MDEDVEEAMETDRLLTPAEVADLLGVCPKTVTRWARKGLVDAQRTLGGHRRFRESEIRRAVQAEQVRDHRRR